MDLNKNNLTKLLEKSDEPMAKAEVAKAFKVQGNEERLALKKLLREAEKEGLIIRGKGRKFSLPSRLPAVTIVEISEIDSDGDVFAIPVQWDDDDKPVIEMRQSGKKNDGDYDIGDRVLAKLKHTSDNTYTGEAIRRLTTKANQILGTLIETKSGLLLQPVNKKSRNDFPVREGDENGAQPGQVVVAEIQHNQEKHLRKEARVIEIVGEEDDPKIISLIAIYENDIRYIFPDEVLESTKGMIVPELGKREDLRNTSLVTIDGADARDFDDAVFAKKDDNPKNKGGYHLIVAIADVSFYVRPGSALDREAYLRGNSTYFADRVVPMLPEALSNDLCSLRPNEERAAMAIHLWINSDGELIKYKPTRALIKSAARLTYEQVQAAKDGNSDDLTSPIMKTVIDPLYDAYALLDKARRKRGTLDLDMPERKILMNDKGEMTGVVKRDRLDSHKLIEEFMILANVAAAKALEDKDALCVYRIHDKPDASRLDSIRDFVEGLELKFPAGQVVKPSSLNGLLKQAKGRDDISHLVSEIVLRAQSQAIYSTNNNGHFGLALTHYAHFTSPIRRYADLIVHRSMVNAYEFGEGGLDREEEARADEIADHISTTERTSMVAERSANDRFTASYLQDKIGEEFMGRISGVTQFGLFVTLDENGADGIIPMRSLKDDYYIHDEVNHSLIGRRTGRVFRLCAPIKVKLLEADGMTGSTVLAPATNESADIPGFKPKRGVNPKSKKYDRKTGPKHSGKKPKPKNKPSFKKNKKKTTPKHKRKKPQR